MKNICRQTLLCMLSLFLAPLYTLMGSELFHHLTEDNGLSSRRSFSVRQDKHGYIWISTKLGIDRFDGKNISRYIAEEKYQRDYGTIGVNNLRLSPDSTIWNFTETGLVFRYNEDRDAMEYVYSVREFLHTYSFTLNDLWFETEEILLLATSKGLMELDTRSGTALTITGTEHLFINHITEHAGMFFLATSQGMITARKEGQALLPFNTLLKEKVVITSWYDPSGNRLVIGTLNSGAYLYELSVAGGEIYPILSTNKPIRCIVDYTESSIALGVDLEGVYVVNKETLATENHFCFDETQPSPLCSNNVRGLFVDNRNNLWVATYHEGVSFQDLSKLGFTYYIHQPGNPRTIGDNIVNAIFEDSDGDLWFGTGNGVSYLDRKNGLWKHYFNQSGTGSRGVDILSICEDSRKTIWAGGYAFGVAEFNKQTGSVKRHLADSPASILASNYIYSVFRDGDRLWFGGHLGEASYYDVKSGESRSFDLGRVSCFAKYGEDHLLLGLLNGLFLFNTVTGEKTPTPINQIITTIEEAEEGAYWIGTRNYGLYYYDLRNDSICNYTTAHRLSSNYIYGIIPYGECLWLSTEKGLNKFNPATGEVEVYDKQDGLLSDQFNNSSYFVCRDGNIILGTTDGAVMFHPDELNRETPEYKYETLISRFDLFHRPVYPREVGSPLLNSIYSTRQIHLDYNQNFFSFHFTTPNFQTPTRTLYSYYLEGHDLDWSTPLPTGMANYSRVAPGKYTFRVRALVNGVPQPEKSILLTIGSPWWLTGCARLIYVFLAGLLGWFIYNTIKAREEKRQTESKIDFFTTTAHDLLTPLNLIQAPLKDLRKEITGNAQGGRLLDMALSNSSKLGHFVEKLLDFQRVSLHADRLVLTRQELGTLLKHRVDSFKLIAGHKSIEIATHIESSVCEMILVDKEKITRILDNLLSNAIKYTPYGGTIFITSSADHNKWYLKVRDTGIGISQREQRMIFKNIFRADNAINSEEIGSGIGLKLVGLLVKLHQGKIAFRSKLNEGTEFFLSFPLKYPGYENQLSQEWGPEKEHRQELLYESDKPAIVVAEDNEELLEYMRIALSESYHLIYCSNGKEALEAVTTAVPRLVISDVVMPEMDGFELCRRLKGDVRTSHIPVLLLTGLAGNENMLEGMRLGAIDYICKPFDREILQNKIFNIFSLQKNSQKQWLEELKNHNAARLSNEVDNEFMGRMQELVEKNIDNPELNIAFLCRELAVSKTLLYNKITQLTGNSPIEFIRMIRLKRAANLLLSGRYSVTEVAFQVGMDNPKYFSRVFKEFYGVSPKEYLARNPKN